MKILITCPPMLGMIDHFKNRFLDLDMSITTPDVVQILTEDELINILPEHDGWIIGDDPATYKVLKAGKNGNLKAAVKWGIGVDNIDFNAFKDLDIPITNTPNMFGEEVADLAMCFVLGLARDAFLVDRKIRSGIWHKPPGISLAKKTIGIVGLGDIGNNIAKRAHSHSMNIIGWDPYLKNTPHHVEIYKWPDKIEKCDFIVFACALTEKNTYMFNKHLLGSLKKDVRIINVSRGPLIQEDALIEGLKRGIINSVALDVFENEPVATNNELLKYERCILSSHNGSNTFDAVERASNEALDLIYKMLKKN